MDILKLVLHTHAALLEMNTFWKIFMDEENILFSIFIPLSFQTPTYFVYFSYMLFKLIIFMVNSSVTLLSFLCYIDVQYNISIYAKLMLQRLFIHLKAQQNEF